METALHPGARSRPAGDHPNRPGDRRPLRRGSSLRAWVALAITLFTFGTSQANDKVRYFLHWIKRTDVGSPGPRYGHAMAYDSKRSVTVFFGGEFSEVGGQPEYFNDTWEYDGVSWKPIVIEGPSPSPRARHAMCFDSWHYQVMLFGGKGDGGASNELWAYESTGPQRGRWTLQKPPAGGVFPWPLSATAAAFDTTRGLVYVAGGTPDPSVSEFPYTKLVWTWDTTLRRWEQSLQSVGFGAGSHGAGLTEHSMLFDEKRKRALVFGGFGPFGLYIQANHRVWCVTGQVGIEPGSLSGYVAGASVYDSFHDVYIEYGGLDFPPGQMREGEGEPGTERVLYPQFARYNESYDPNQILVDVWNGFPPLEPEPRSQVAMVYDSKRAATVLFGGVGGARFGDTWEFVTFDLHQVWLDFANQGYRLGTLEAPLNELREATELVLTNGTVHIRGGFTPETGILNKPMKLTAYDGPAVLGRKAP